MKIIEIKDKKLWDDFVLSQPYNLFVQSPKYGEFYRELKEEFWIFGIYEDEKLIGGSLVVSMHARRGNFLYLPYGPILDYKKPEVLKEFSDFLKKFAKEKNYSFIRVSSFVSEKEENKKLFKNLGYKSAPMHILAETTWLLDLESKNDEDIMKEMNKNHRNLIRRCQKENVRIEKRNDSKALELFNTLHDQTAKRHNFHRFADDYVEKEFKNFSPENSLIYLAYLPDGQLDSAAIIMYYGNMAAYRHGASLMLDKKIPTSYLVQWEAIQEAKKRGVKWYNFWGVAPDGASKNHPFKGITHFKKGFGGFQRDILHCQDLPVSYKYWFNWLIEEMRRVKRGF